MGKNLYEFINMSDKITFYAKNDDYARALTLLLGEGKAGCKKENGESIPYCMTAFQGSAPQEVYDQISEMVRSGDEELEKALNSVAVCDFSEREIFDDYTENGSNEEKWQKWDNKHRTSLNDFGKYARGIAKNLQNKRLLGAK